MDEAINFIITEAKHSPGSVDIFIRYLELYGTKHEVEFFDAEDYLYDNNILNSQLLESGIVELTVKGWLLYG